ncbi:MAG: SLATT domain-containing protein [Fusobacteriaceae bacterium]
MIDNKKIKERIWNTKKARICMEARVIKENKIINNWIFGFSISLVILSLLGFLESQIINIVTGTAIELFVSMSFKSYGIVSIILSIILLCFTIKLDVENQVNRVWMIRHCYTELAKLEFSDKESKELNNSYQDILVRYENHEPKDYFDSIKDDKTKKINFLEKCLFFIILFLIFIIGYLISSL